MNDNPYSNSYGGEAGDVVGEERTSALSITSLVLSLTCCLSPVGLLLGIISLITIKGSKGRVKGSGMAVAAIVIGLILSVVLVAVGVGASQANAAFSKMGFGGAETVLRSIESDDFDGARAALSSPVDTMSDGELIAFRDAYFNQLGAFQSVPGTLLDSFPMYAEVQGSMANYQGGGNVVPIPGMFDSGVALVVAFLDQSNAGTTSGGLPTPLLTDLAVVLSDGTELLLSDFMGEGGDASGDAGTGSDAEPDTEPDAEPSTGP